MNRVQQMTFYFTAFIIAVYFLFLGLVEAKAFLAPFFTAIILSLLMLPLARKMERKISRSLAALISSFLLFLISLVFVGLVSLQVKQFMEDWPEIKEKMQPKIEKLKSFVVENTPLKRDQLETKQLMKKSSSTSSQESSLKASSNSRNMITKIFGLFGNYLLTFIYIFFMLTYRRRLKIFLLKIFPPQKKQRVKDAINKSASVAPNYLIGKLMLMAVLAVLYAIGLGFSGVNNFILVSILAALLSIIPYIGNIIGFTIAVAVGFLSTGNAGTLIGITVTFAVAQFVESYVMEPYVVGDKVDLHPFIIILVVIIGNMVWGIIGMILAIPLMGILTVILLHSKELRPLGEFFSKNEMDPE